MHACMMWAGGGTADARSVSRLWGQSRQSVDTDQTVPPLASIGGEEVMLKGDIGLSMHVQQEGGALGSTNTRGYEGVALTHESCALIDFSPQCTHTCA